ncbi:MAG: fibronectin type III domain-containing protein, partial [Nitrospinota bacterium]|nr:fibronectin type III domain-containing protein [Nitrospinota bacterium]
TCNVTDGLVIATQQAFLDVLGLPKAITNVTAAGDDTKVNLAWTADPIADTYNIYWNTVGKVTTADSKISGAIGTTFIHTGLVNGQTYYYRVSGVNLSGEGPLSAEVKAFPSPPPTNLTVTPDFYSNTLSWTGCPGSTYYKIYWNKTGGVTKADSAISVTWGATIYAHAVLTGNQPYYYRVAGVNPVGETVLSAEMMGVPLPHLTATPVHNGVVLSWDAFPRGTTYNIYWNTTGNITTLDNPNEGLTTNYLLIRNLTPGVTHYFALVPVIGGTPWDMTAPSSALVGPKISFTPIGLLPYGAIYHEATDIFDPATSTIITYVGYTTVFSYDTILSVHNAGDTITNLPINPANTLPTTGYWARGAVWGGYAYFTRGTTTAYAPILGSGSLGSWITTSDAGNPVWRRTLHQTLAYNGRMYTLGGYTYSTPDCLSDIRYTTINANGTLNPWTINATAIPWCTYRHGATISPYGHMYFSNGAMLQMAPVNAATGAVGTFAPLTVMPPGFNTVNFDNSHQGMIVYNGYLMVPSISELYILRVDPATGDTISWIDTIPLPYSCNTRTFYVKGGALYFAARGGTGSVFRIDGLSILASYP